MSAWSSLRALLEAPMATASPFSSTAVASRPSGTPGRDSRASGPRVADVTHRTKLGAPGADSAIVRFAGEIDRWIDTMPDKPRAAVVRTEAATALEDMVRRMAQAAKR